MGYYYRAFLPNMAALTRPLNNLLKKGVQFVFTREYVDIVRRLLDKLASPDVLAFPNFDDAIAGVRKFRVITDASTDGLGAVVEQDQPDGTTRPLCFLSRSTLPNERNWSATELECGALVWAIKKNRQLFYGIPFEVVTDHQPLLNLESLSSKVNRVQRWYDFLSAYTYTLTYRPGKKNGNADMMSRLPLPATAADSSLRLQLTDPDDVDVYMIGACGVQPADVRAPMVSSLGGLPSMEPSALVSEEERVSSAGTLLTTYHKSEQNWKLLQADLR